MKDDARQLLESNDMDLIQMGIIILRALDVPDRVISFHITSLINDFTRHPKYPRFEITGCARNIVHSTYESWFTEELNEILKWKKT
jgi:hypothetical protein